MSENYVKISGYTKSNVDGKLFCIENQKEIMGKNQKRSLRNPEHLNYFAVIEGSPLWLAN